MRDDVRAELLKAALNGRTVTYGRLMKRFHLSRGRGVVGAIVGVDSREARRGAPGFAPLVVRKDTGYPGGGFFCWDGVPPPLRRPSREATNPKLSEAEKRYVRGLQEEVWRFYQSELHRES